MHGSRPTRWATGCSRRRTGAVARRLVVAVAVLLLLSAVAWHLLAEFSRSFDKTEVVLHQVERGEFVREFSERGNIESAENVEIKCEVQSHGSGTRILWVIPEGTYVEPAPDWKPDPDNPDADPPDLLVKLDSSKLEEQKMQQQIACYRREAEMIEADKNLDTAQFWLTVYSESTYKQEKERIESWIFVSQEEHSRAHHYLDYREALLAKGYVTAPMVDRDRFSVEKARNDWHVARTAMKVLDDHTRPKFLKARRSDIEICHVGVEANEQLYRIDTEKLALIEEQIGKCTIRAPVAGQVVYANEQRQRGREVVIEEGTVVREHQVLIRLPDPDTMQIKATIDEANVAMVEEGMPVRILLDAFEDLELGGSVLKVNEYPEASAWYGGAVKEYATIIGIDKLPEDEAGKPLVLRPGMTAEVKIGVETLPDVIQVPVRTVFEQAGKHFCVRPDGENFELRGVTIGSSNDETVVIREGLEAGDQVVTAAASHLDELGLSQLPPETPDRPLMHQVQSGEFVCEITERGSIESADNVEIKCATEGLWGAGTMILWVIPEGTRVEPAPDWKPDPANPEEDPPDLLVKLDSSKLEEQATQHEVWCKLLESVVIRAKNDLEMAQLELKEYVEGTYVQQKQTIENRVVVAEEYYNRALEDLAYDEAFLARGFVTSLTVEASRFAVAKAKKDLEAVRTELKVLTDYTRPKREKSFDAKIKTGVATLDSKKKEHQLMQRTLAKFRSQIERCTIRAPEAGQVVYANEKNWSGQPVIIEEGTVVRQHQVLIRLPDPTTMQVKARINEASVTMVEVGMPTRIHLDAFEGVELSGSVQKVNDYPEPSVGAGSVLQEYETTVKIDGLPQDKTGKPLDLRPGMTAEVKVHVKTLPNVIQVPLQAVIKHGERHYCVRLDGEAFRLHEVTAGSSNDKSVVILKGLEVGESVVLNAAAYRKELDLPQLPPQTPDSRWTTPQEQPSVVRNASPKGPGNKGA